MNKGSFDIGPVPSWVKPVEPGREVEIGADNPGMVYLVVDRQENLDRNAFYYREVRKIVSEKGVERGVSIGARFNPTFEKLTFHSIKVIRDGTVSNRLDRSRIELVPKEKEPDRALYDPSVSVRTVLDNVRVGDNIELAFSIEGANPLNRGKYSKLYLVQWEVPIIHNVLRLVYPADRKLAFRPRNGAREPSVTTANGVSELWYEDRNVPPRSIEPDDAPDDYEPRQLLEITEFRNWAEVAEWATPILSTAPATSRELDAEIKKLRGIIDPEQRVLTAVQFVQSEIRYVRMGMWFAARPLASADEILRRRFANHLDKAALLLALLRAAQTDAAPALVSGSFRDTLREFLPSADILDHVLVQVRLGQNTYWINPAATDQRGPLWQMYVPRYGCALVLRPGTTDLTPFEPPPESFPVKKIVENYRIPPPDKTPELEIISEYRGQAADRARAFFRDNAREEIEKRYLEYYARTFPDAKTQKAPWYEELPGENACRVTESYIVPRLWQLNEEKNRYALYVQPLEVYSAIGSTISPERQDPLKRDYPSTVFEEINVHMFEDWPLNAEGVNVDNEFFRLRDEPSGSGSTVQLHFSYEALKDRVQVNEIDKFNELINQTKDRLGYTLRYQTPEQIKKTKSLAAFNWAIAASAFCFFITGSFLACGYFRRSKLPQQLPPPVDAPARLNGIGGWLILLAIGQMLLPLRFAKPAFDVISAAIDTASWRLLTDPVESSYHAWWAPTLLFELFYNLAAFLFAGLLLALFFTRKAAWRRAFALFPVFVLVGVVLDTIFVDRIPSAAQPLLTSLLDIVPIIVTAAIWIPYVSFSKRVKATFRY